MSPQSEAVLCSGRPLAIGVPKPTRLFYPPCWWSLFFLFSIRAVFGAPDYRGVESLSMFLLQLKTPGALPRPGVCVHTLIYSLAGQYEYSLLCRHYNT